MGRESNLLPLFAFGDDGASWSVLPRRCIVGHTIQALLMTPHI